LFKKKRDVCLLIPEIPSSMEHSPWEGNSCSADRLLWGLGLQYHILNSPLAEPISLKMEAARISEMFVSHLIITCCY